MVDGIFNWIGKWFKACERPSGAPGNAAAVATSEHRLDTHDLAQAEQVLQCVSQLTTVVASEVGHHQDSIQDINTKLTALPQGDAAAVGELVRRLLAANHELQSRLERAELKLQAHTRQLHDVTVVARTDGLTNLMNRRALDQELNRCLGELQRRGRAVALMMVDVDHFKR